MKMFKKIISLFLVAVICLGSIPTIITTNTLGISYTASLDKETFEVSGADQTFVLTINAS